MIGQRLSRPNHGCLCHETHTHSGAHTDILHDLLLWWVHNSNQSRCLCWPSLWCAPVTTVDGWVSHRGESRALLSPPFSPLCRSHWKLWTTLLLPGFCSFSILHSILLYSSCLYFTVFLFFTSCSLSPQTLLIVVNDCYNLVSDTSAIVSLRNKVLYDIHIKTFGFNFCYQEILSCFLDLLQLWEKTEHSDSQTAVERLNRIFTRLYCMLYVVKQTIPCSVHCHSYNFCICKIVTMWLLHPQEGAKGPFLIINPHPPSYS